MSCSDVALSFSLRVFVSLDIAPAKRLRQDQSAKNTSLGLGCCLKLATTNGLSASPKVEGETEKYRPNRSSVEPSGGAEEPEPASCLQSRRDVDGDRRLANRELWGSLTLAEFKTSVATETFALFD